MGPALKAAKKQLPATPWGHLPPRMRILFITGLHRTGGWLAEALVDELRSEQVNVSLHTPETAPPLGVSIRDDAQQ